MTKKGDLYTTLFSTRQLHFVTVKYSL